MSLARCSAVIAGRLSLLLFVGAPPAVAGDPPRVVDVSDESLTAGARAVVEDAGALLTSPLRMDRYDALTFGGAVAVVGGLMAVDNPINRLIQRNTTSGGVNAFDKVNNWLGPSALAGINAGVVVIGLTTEEFGGSNKLKRTGLIGLEAEAFAVVAATALKVVTGRARPDANEGATHFKPFSGLDTSFPSGHAAASFAVATVFAERYPGPVAWTAYTLAATVSFARLYTNQHWTSDVVAGALIGWGMGYFLSKRHAEEPDDWHIRPITMDRGMGAGVAIGKAF